MVQWLTLPAVNPWPWIRILDSLSAVHPAAAELLILPVWVGIKWVPGEGELWGTGCPAVTPGLCPGVIESYPPEAQETEMITGDMRSYSLCPQLGLVVHSYFPFSSCRSSSSFFILNLYFSHSSSSFFSSPSLSSHSFLPSSCPSYSSSSLTYSLPPLSIHLFLRFRSHLLHPQHHLPLLTFLIVPLPCSFPHWISFSYHRHSCSSSPSSLFSSSLQRQPHVTRGMTMRRRRGAQQARGRTEAVAAQISAGGDEGKQDPLKGLVAP